jgi:hypothetical protein
MLVPTLIPHKPAIDRLVVLLGVAAIIGPLSGCHDGPMYALKAANPYYAMGDWKRDRERGVTDHQRREELMTLADSIEAMPAERQQVWTEHLTAILANDQNPEMRRLAIQTAGNMNAVPTIDLIEKGLDDESFKVRMEACRALASKATLASDQSNDAARMLASTVGTETNDDVRRAAISALANHKSPIAISSLKTALRDRNPATQTLVINSLRGVTGEDHGEDPQTWIAALDSKPTGSVKPTGPFDEAATKIADRANDLFR